MAAKRSLRSKRKDRRKYLRSKRVQGTITDDEGKELDLLNAPNGLDGPDGDMAPSDASDRDEESADDVPAPGRADSPHDSESRETHGGGLPGTPAHVVSPIPPPIPSAPLPPAPSLPRPPRVAPAPEPEEVKRGGSIGGKWQDRWRHADGGDGRESTCVGMADQVIAVLQVMADQIKMIGVDPIIDPQSLKASYVLTFDQVLPDRVRLTPPMKAVGGSTVLLVQRFIKRKEIADAMKSAEDKAKHDDFRRKQHLHPVPPSPPAEPRPPEPRAPEPAVAPPVQLRVVVATDATGHGWTREEVDSLSPADRETIFPSQSPPPSDTNGQTVYDPEGLI